MVGWLVLAFFVGFAGGFYVALRLGRMAVDSVVRDPESSRRMVEAFRSAGWKK